MNVLLQLAWVVVTSAAVCEVGVNNIEWASCSWLTLELVPPPGGGFISVGVSGKFSASNQCDDRDYNSSCTDWRVFDSSFNGSAESSYELTDCPPEGYSLTTKLKISLKISDFHNQNSGRLFLHTNCDTTSNLECSTLGLQPIQFPQRSSAICAQITSVSNVVTEKSLIQQDSRLQIIVSRSVNVSLLSVGWLVLESNTNPTLASLLSRSSTGNIVQIGGSNPNTTLFIKLGSLSSTSVAPAALINNCPDLSHYDIFRNEIITLRVDASVLVPPSDEFISTTFTVVPSVGIASLSIKHSSENAWLGPTTTTVSLIKRNATIIEMSLCSEDLYVDQVPPPIIESSLDWLADFYNSEIRFQTWMKISTKVAQFSLPPVPQLTASWNSTETLTVRLSSLSSSGFMSGIQPELQGSSNETGFVVNIQMECENPILSDCSGCIHNYNIDSEGFCKVCPLCVQGKCIQGPMCLCDTGYEGIHCDVVQDSAITGAVAGSSVVASVALEVALGGSLVAPIHSLTFLQLLYITGSNSCTKPSAHSSLLSLRAVVFPLQILATDHKYTNYFLGTLILHSGITVFVLLIVVVNWFITPTAYRRLRDVAGQVFFPNLLILLLYIGTVPLTAGFLKAAAEGVTVIVIVGGIWAVVNIFGYGAFLYWFLKKKLNTDTGRNYYIEYLEINMGNSFTNATCAISSPRRKHVMPSWLLVWLPTGHWCCRHLRDRLFMRKYALVFDELLPRSVTYYPIISFYRIVILSVISSVSDSGCEPRICIIVFISVIYLVYLIRQKPYKSSGTNLAVTLSHLFFCLAIASFVINESLTTGMLISLAIVVTATALWTGIVFLITRNRYDPALSEQAAADDENADFACLPKAVGSVTIYHKGKLSDNAEIVLQKTKDFGERVWCELRGSLLLIYKKGSDGLQSSEYSTKHSDIVPLYEAKGIPLGEEGFAICKDNGKKGKVIAFACEKEGEAENWMQKILESINGTSLTVSGDAQALLPKINRIQDYDFFGDAMPTSYGKLRHCNLRGGSEHLLLSLVDKKLLTASQRRNIATEIIILSKLKSDFLVRVSCPFETDEEICWVVPYQTGGNLVYHLEMSGKFSEQDAAFWTAEAVLGLDHLHANLIVFRNLAPTDLLFSQSGHLMLADPGLPVALPDENKVSYASPEVLKFTQPSPSSDYWSLGCVLYEMIHNRRAFDGSSRAVTANLVLRGAPRFDPECSPSLQKFISSLLSKSNRPCRASEVKDFIWFSDNNISWSSIEDRTTPPPFLVAGPDPPIREGSVKLVNPLAFTFSGSREEEETQFSTFDADVTLVSSPAPLLPSSSTISKQKNE